MSKLFSSRFEAADFSEFGSFIFQMLVLGEV